MYACACNMWGHFKYKVSIFVKKEYPTNVISFAKFLSSFLIDFSGMIINDSSLMKVSVRSLKNLEMLRLYLKRPHVIFWNGIIFLSCYICTKCWMILANYGTILLRWHFEVQKSRHFQSIFEQTEWPHSLKTIPQYIKYVQIKKDNLLLITPCYRKKYIKTILNNG